MLQKIVIALICLASFDANAGLFTRHKEGSSALKQHRTVFKRNNDKSKHTQLAVKSSKKPPAVKTSVTASSKPQRRETPLQAFSRGVKSMFVRTTAYTHTESDHLQYGRLNAIGTTLRCEPHYTSAAADWSRFPLGTKFKISGEPTVYVIDDCGGALWGTNTIDIYRPSMSAMHAWGTRHVQIEVLHYGYKESKTES